MPETKQPRPEDASITRRQFFNYIKTALLSIGLLGSVRLLRQSWVDHKREQRNREQATAIINLPEPSENLQAPIKKALLEIREGLINLQMDLTSLSSILNIIEEDLKKNNNTLDNLRKLQIIEQAIVNQMRTCNQIFAYNVDYLTTILSDTTLSEKNRYELNDWNTLLYNAQTYLENVFNAFQLRLSKILSTHPEITNPRA